MIEYLVDRVSWFWEIKQWQSSLLAKLVDRTWPRFLVRWATRKIIDIYKVDLSDSKKPLKAFRSVNEFFVREMREEARPIDQDKHHVVSPVDGTVQALGELKEDVFLQAKGILYPLDRLVPSDRVKDYRDGFFITIYLSPRDGHRIFSHYEGRIVSSCHVPGLLYKVREPFVSEIRGLFALSERLVTFLETDLGPMALIQVAALNVARITATYDASITTNIGGIGIVEKSYEPPFLVARGQHVATFNLGSTVILLFPKGVVEKPLKSVGESLKYGQPLLKLNGS